LRVPLGIHQVTKRPSFFYDPSAPIDKLAPMDAIEALTTGVVLSDFT
jgi:hypothetical protein